MKAMLVRVGIDQEYGHWNSPADETSRRFVYVPIPEVRNQHRGCERRYEQLIPHLTQFASDYNLDIWQDLKFPVELKTSRMHLDPDFEYLTYGDDGYWRGSDLREFGKGDLVVFYAGLRPIHPKNVSLIYGLIGIIVVDEIVYAKDVERNRWDENAHTRRENCSETDIIVRGISGKSGRCEKFLPIGEFRDRAYRVKKDILDAWGGLSVKDGFIQRSARPPRFLDPEKFYKWFRKQQIELIQENNPEPDPKIVIVHLRRPKQQKKEMRSDPFYEFGCFGITGCHKRNLMNPEKIRRLDGVRLAFAQGGPKEFKLIQLTSPVTYVNYRNCCELKWEKDGAPFFKYEKAPLLINNKGYSDFPRIVKMLRSVNRNTWTQKFSSRFRTSSKLLRDDVAQEIFEKYSLLCKNAHIEHFANNYWETMHKPPPKKDINRAKTYQKYLQKADVAKYCICKCR